MKKKFNKNIIVFGLFAVLVITGIWGNCFGGLVNNGKVVINNVKELKVKAALETLKYLDNISSENLSYHDFLMDLNSIRINLLNNKAVIKDNSTTIKAAKDTLIMPSDNKLGDKEIDEVTDRLLELKEKSESLGADFMYLAIPEKGYYQTVAPNIKHYAKENFDKLINSLNSKNITNLNFVDVFIDRGISDDDLFYITDHHWKTNYGLLAAQSTCEELNKLYGFLYDKTKFDINNYKVKTLPNWFLGALGKRTGRFFTWSGADDFDLITPKYKTSIEEIKPFEDSVRSGSIEETLLYMDRIETKDYYNKDPYAGYCGGNYRLQIIKNNLNKDGKKVLLIKDSFAFVVAPFIATQVSELHIADTRGKDVELYDERVNWYEYMEEIKPDIVMVLYKGIPYETMLDFEGSIID